MNSNIQQFLKEVLVIDTETTGLLDKEDSEIIEIAAGKYDSANELSIEDRLFGSVNPIPPEASAVNYISNRMIEGLPALADSFDYVDDIMGFNGVIKYVLVAHNSDFDRRMFVKEYTRYNNKDGLGVYKNKENWLCTLRLAKSILGTDGPHEAFNLNYLRYYFELDVDDDIPGHRASCDVIVTAKLLEKLIEIGIEKGLIDEDKEIRAQLNNLCWNPIKISKWNIGKHKGKKIADIPTDYLLWCIDKLDFLDSEHPNYDEDLAASVATVLEARL